MKSLKGDMYDEAFRMWHMVPDREFDGYGPAGSLYRFDGERGTGEYWVYFCGNMFAVNAFEMSFAREGVMRYRHAEHLSIAYYEVAEGVEQTGGSPASGSVSSYIAEEGEEYVAHYVPGSRTRATSMTISPDYYRDHLAARFGAIPDVRRAFELVDGRRYFPELVRLFKQVRAYRGDGMSADLFYEGAVAEAVALVIAHAAEAESGDDEGVRLDRADREAIEALAGHISAHLGDDLSAGVLAARACMGLTKFREAFRAVYGTTPGDYVARVRMERAAELLRTTDLPVAQVGAHVGYRKPGAFAKAFRRHVGATPSDLRASRR